MSGEGHEQLEDKKLAGAPCEPLSSAADCTVEPHEDSELYQPGDLIARNYEVICHVGSGGMSVVYKARHLLLDKTFAVKYLRADSVPNARAVKRFQQEAQAVSRLEHPNIVKVSELDVDESGHPYLVMDYVEGVSVSKLIEDTGPLNARRTIALILQAADALQHAHEQGIVHRDVKPSNIILTKDTSNRETVKLVDFGIAKINIPDREGLPLTQTGEVCGSPYYMSPEQCLGQQVDGRSDIYALGCVLYECLFGHPPFRKASFLETLMAHVQEPPEIDEEKIGPALKMVLERSLAKDKSKRYQSLTYMHADLNLARQGKMPRLAGSRKVKQAKRKDNLIIGIVGICTVLLVGLLALLSPRLQKTARGDSSPQTPADTFAPDTAGGDRKFFGSATPGDLEPGKIPPHVIRPLDQLGDTYAEADSFDEASRRHFMNGEYDQAIMMLDFQTKTYKEGGTHYGDPNIETVYLAMAHLHLGECYVCKQQPQLALRHYKKALELYAKVTTPNPKMYNQAVFGYTSLLTSIGKAEDAKKVLEEFQKTGRVSYIPCPD